MAEMNRDESWLIRGGWYQYLSSLDLPEHYLCGWDTETPTPRDITESCPSCSHIESKQSFRTWLVQNRERESENITAGKYQTKAVAAERFVKELLEKNSYQSRFRISYNACQLKGNNSQTMYLTLLYCEKPMLLNLICLTCQN